MSNLKMIEMLCKLVEEQGRIIRHLVMELMRARNLTEAEEKMIAAAKRHHTELLGADEVPDDI